MEAVVAVAQLGLRGIGTSFPRWTWGPPSRWTRVHVETRVVSSAVATGTRGPSSSQVLGCGRR